MMTIVQLVDYFVIFDFVIGEDVVDDAAEMDDVEGRPSINIDERYMSVQKVKAVLVELDDNGYGGCELISKQYVRENE